MLRVVGLAEPILVFGLSRIRMLAGIVQEGSVMQAVLVEPALNAEATYPLGSDHIAEKRLESLEKLRELLIGYEQSFAALKKKSTKQLKKGDTGSIDILGAELSAALQCAGFLPYQRSVTLRLVETAIDLKKTAITTAIRKQKPVQKALVQKLVQPPVRRFQKFRREGITACSNWAEQFTGLAAQVPPGETRFVNRETVTRSPDGNTIETRYATVGKWRVLKHTVTETDVTIVKIVEAKFSKYSRDDGKIGESYEKETTISFKATANEGVRQYRSGAFAPLLSKDNLPPQVEPRLDRWAWYDFLRQFVRVNPDTMRFTIGNREYQIDQYRFREMARRGQIVQCLGIRGQVAEPYISQLAEKLAYLHRTKQYATFETIIEESLPWLIGNLDYFDDSYEETRKTTMQQFQRPRATMVAHTPS